MPGLVRYAVITAAFGGMATANAQTAHYHFHSIVINGASSVVATAINDHGIIAGNEVSGTTYDGFVLSHGSLTILPKLCQGVGDDCTAIPTAITDNGLVAGYYSNSFSYAGFVWQHGSYQNAANIDIGSFGCATPVLAINAHGFAAFNSCSGSELQYPYAGLYTAPVKLPIGNFAAVVGVNRRNEVAGTYVPFVGSIVIPSLFIYGAAGKLTSVLPSGAQSASGGFINDEHQLAGTYVDSAGETHGFVFQHGKYTSFDLPVTGYQMAVQAIDGTGRVAGTFVDAENASQQIFVYTGVQVNILGNFDQSDIVTLALNSKGVMAVTDLQGSAGYAYRVTCTGSAC